VVGVVLSCLGVILWVVGVSGFYMLLDYKIKSHLFAYYVAFLLTKGFEGIIFKSTSTQTQIRGVIMDAHFVGQVAKHGFLLEQTGGGCTWFRRDDGEGCSTVITTDDTNAPDSFSTYVEVSEEDDCGVWTDLGLFDTLTDYFRTQPKKV
jgi:hypothetical protein